MLFRQQDNILKYYDRLRKIDKLTPLYKVYSDLRNFHINGHRNWYSKVMDIIEPLENITVNSNGDILHNDTSIDSSLTYLTLDTDHHVQEQVLRSSEYWS